MTTIPDNQLRAECLNVLVDHFGYLDTERFVVMMSRSPEDYTTWHQRHFDNGESVRELGEKIKKFAAAKRQSSKDENAMKGTVVKKSAVRLLAAAAILSAGVALAADEGIKPIPGYDILEYLESSGTQYIDTGVVYANDTKLTQRFCVVDFAGAQMQMGALDTVSGAYHRFHWGITSSGNYIVWAGIGGNGQATRTAGSDGWVNLTKDAAGSYDTDDGHSTLAIFARNEGGTFTCGKFRVGQTCIWKNGLLVRNMVPARRKADDVLGLYDYCKPKFYLNEGTGDFAAGPAMNYLVLVKSLPDSQQSIDSAVEEYSPLPVVKDGQGNVLARGVDYSVVCTNNTRFGVGTCTISGLGDFAAAPSITAEFRIAPEAKLPTDFQRLFYLETTATVHYVDTDIHPTANTRITALAQMTAKANTQVVGILDTPNWRRFHTCWEVDKCCKALLRRRCWPKRVPVHKR